MKKVIDHMEKEGKDAKEIDAFKKKIQAWVMSLLSKDRFKNLAFYIGENMAEGRQVFVINLFNAHLIFRGEGQVAIVEFRDEADGEHPYLLLVKEALIEEKC